MVGWIKLHRKIKNHWIWKDPVKFQWWLTMLLEVNYSEGKMMLGNRIVKVARGSSTNSLRTWADLFQCGTKATTNFFDLLESDGMITRMTLGKGKHSTTLINITNYNDFQGNEETLNDTLTDTQGKHKGNLEGIQSKKDNKGKEIKEKKKREDFSLKFLRDNYPDKFKEFRNKWSKEISDYETMTNKLHNTLKLEISKGKLSWKGNEIFPRMENYAISWKDNEKDKDSKGGHYMASAKLDRF